MQQLGQEHENDNDHGRQLTSDEACPNQALQDAVKAGNTINQVKR